MYTGLDVLIIVLATIFFTAIFTLVVVSCAIANGTEKDKEEAYRHGYADGKKAGGENDRAGSN